MELKTTITKRSPTTPKLTILTIVIIVGIVGVALLSFYTVGTLIGYTERTLKILGYCFALDGVIMLALCIITLIMQAEIPSTKEEC